MTQEVRYKLAIRFEVTKVLVDVDVPASGEHYTGERLTIDTNLDLNSAATLSAVLQMVDKVQAVINGNADEINDH